MLKSIGFIGQFPDNGLVALADALQFGFLKTALVQERFFPFRRQVSCRALRIAFLLVARHQGLETGDFIGHLMPRFGHKPL